MAKAPAKLNKPMNNRIIGSGMERVDQMLANPLNFRIHPDNQQQALAGAIDDIGFIRSVTVNKRTGRVIDGHLRVILAARSGVEEIPVEYVDLDEDEEAQALLSLDPIAAMAASDKQKLDELLHQVQSDDERVQEMMAEIAEKEGLYQDENAGRDAEPQINKAEELREKWQTETGQLWQLGDHRIICGDCTDKAVVDRVMWGEVAELTLTDPPYGIDVVPDNGEIGWSTKQAKVTKFSKVINDDKLMDVSFLLDSADKVAIFGGQYFAHYLPKAGRWLVWDKDFTDAERDFVPFSECELVWSNITGVAVKKYKCRSMGYSREGESGSRMHPNQKPLKVIQGIIGDFSKENSFVYDPFLGSGTTLIACENLHRKCRGIEISPAYIAVVLQRWADLTGKTPELLT